MIHPVVVNPIISPLVRVTDTVRWRAGKLAPDGAILYYDADIDAFSEQTGGPHSFNHNVLGPQHQRNADGSYANVGAKPAVDVFGGKKWLRSCGAITNMLTNSVFAGAVSGSPGTAPTGWSLAFNTGSLVANGTALVFSVAAQRHVLAQSVSLVANTVYRFQLDIQTDGAMENGAIALVANLPSVATFAYELDGVASTQTAKPSAGAHTLVVIVTVSSTSGSAQFRCGAGCDTNRTGTVTLCCPQLTATAYPQPYVPTTAAGPVTQPASNATTTNGVWFALPDGSPLWHALTGQPLTLATRVRMGVGSADLGANQSIIRAGTTTANLLYASGATDGRAVKSFDGTAGNSWLIGDWSRNAIIQMFVQVEAGGSRYRVGKRIEGVDAGISWGGLLSFDGSFNPSTLYRLMLGYNNAYPMWLNKITAWKKQATDAEILEAMA